MQNPVLIFGARKALQDEAAREGVIVALVAALAAALAAATRDSNTMVV